LAYTLCTFSTEAQDQFSPEQIARLEARILNGNYDEPVKWPPLPRSNLWMPKLISGQGIGVCEDLLRIRRLEFLPRSSSYTPTIGRLPGYAEFSWAAGGRSPMSYNQEGWLLSWPKEVEQFDYKRLDTPKSAWPDRIISTSLLKLPVPGSDTPLSILFQDIMGSWRGNGSKIHILSPDAPDLGNYFSLSADQKPKWEADHMATLEDAFIGSTTKIIIAPDGGLYIASSRHGNNLYALSGKGRSKQPVCKIDMLPNGTIQPEFQALRTFMTTLRRMQGDASHCCGTMNTHARKHRWGANARRHAVIRPWMLPKAYNSAPTIWHLHLKHWGYQDPVSFRDYLIFFKTYEGAIKGMKSAITQIYGYEPENIDRLAEQTIYYLIGNHFAFPGGQFVPQDLPPDISCAPEIVLIPRIFRGCSITATEVSSYMADFYDKSDDKPIQDEHIQTLEELDPDHGKPIPEFVPYNIFAGSLYNLELFELLLSRPDLNIDTENVYGKTILMHAAHINDHHKLSRLITAGADLNRATLGSNIRVNQIKNYPFQGSFEHGRDYFHVKHSRSALDYALENADFLLIMTLLEAGAERADNDLKLEEILAVNPHLDDGARSFIQARLEPKNP